MDQKLFLLINRNWIHPALDRLMAILSSFDCWFPLIILAALLALWRGGFRARTFVLVAALTVGLADGGISNPLKRLANRPRPSEVQPSVRQVDLANATPRLLAISKPLKIRASKLPKKPVPGRSFPSSHTSNCFALAALSAVFFPRRGWLALLPALGVAYSRVYTGAHWPSDVLASIFLGLGIGAACALAAELAWRKFGPRFATTLAARYPSLF